MFSCHEFLFTCSHVFTCTASFTCSEVFICGTDYTLSLPFTLDEEFICTTPFTLAVPFDCDAPFECLPVFDCLYWDDSPRPQRARATSIVHAFAHWWVPPRRLIRAGANVLSNVVLDRIIYVRREPIAVSIIHGGIVHKMDPGIRYVVGGHIITKDTTTREILVKRAVNAKSTIHAGLIYNTKNVYSVMIGGHIIPVPAVMKDILVTRSVSGKVILHGGIWYSAEVRIPFSIGSHILTTYSGADIKVVSKSASSVGIMHTGVAIHITEGFEEMFRTVYKDVGLASGENINMQLIENNTVYVALFSGGIEITGGSYARASVGFGPIYATAGEKVDSNTDATFPKATAQWDDIDEVRIFSASTGGTQYIAMPIATFDVPLNYVLQFNSGDIEIEAT